jgi:class 3 adenylate cyclase
VDTLRHMKEHLSKFVPLAVRRLVEEHPEAPELQRRERDVSILFVDVSGYTRLSLQMDQDKVDALVERYFSHFLDCVHEHGGDIAETSGDGMMVVFLADDAPEHARQAAVAALQILEMAEHLNREWGRTNAPIAVHIGVNSGLALVGASRFEGALGSRWTFTANGTVANLAARLADAAAPSTILAGPETAKRIGDHFILEALGPQTFKNLDVVEVYRLCGKKMGVFS